MKQATTFARFSSVWTAVASLQRCNDRRSTGGFGHSYFTRNATAVISLQIIVNNRDCKTFRNDKKCKNQRTSPANEPLTCSYSTTITLTSFLYDDRSIHLSVSILACICLTPVEYGGPDFTRHTTLAAGMDGVRFTVFKRMLRSAIGKQEFILVSCIRGSGAVLQACQNETGPTGWILAHETSQHTPGKFAYQLTRIYSVPKGGLEINWCSQVGGSNHKTELQILRHGE